MTSELALEVSEAAWLAGIIDGEGYVGVKKSHATKEDGHNSWQTMIVISMTCKDTIDYLHTLVPGGNYSPRNLGGNRKVQFTWGVSAAPIVYSVAKAIIPYSVTKKNQLLFLREICERRTLVGNTGGCRITDPYYHALCEKLSTMNRKGV